MFTIVTGGAGFIGSHLVDALIERGDGVLVIDNLSAGKISNISCHTGSGAFEMLEKDLLSEGWQDRFSAADRVYHIAADPDVRASAAAPQPVFDNNVTATQNVLESMRKYDVDELVFTSTSTVYGEASVIPTPENYSPMMPISVYAGTKLACEAMISSYMHTYGMKAWIFRFANIIGSRSSHGVIWDFIHKLKSDPTRLEILGDGKQIKSYMSVDACIDALLYVTDKTGDTCNYFNIGTKDWIDVTAIARIVIEEMGLNDVMLEYTGGDRGWIGDVPKMQLSVDRLKSTGWRTGTDSEKSVRMTVRALLKEI